MMGKIFHTDTFCETNAMNTRVVVVDPQRMHVRPPLFPRDRVRGKHESQASSQYLLVSRKAVFDSGDRRRYDLVETLVGIARLQIFHDKPACQGKRHENRERKRSSHVRSSGNPVRKKGMFLCACLIHW